jgi:hypothetical protein
MGKGPTKGNMAMTRTLSAIYYNIIAPIIVIGTPIIASLFLVKIMQVAGPCLERVMG